VETRKRYDTLELLPDAPPFGRELVRSLGLRGLHCGSGPKLAGGGWLNTDQYHLRSREQEATEPGRIARLNGELYYLEHDAREPFPFDDESFDWVYSEHFIEHLYPGDAVAWLAEVRRILRPGGHVRISTPDLRKYVHGYLDPEQAFFSEHHRRIAPHLEPMLIDPHDESQPPRRRELRRRYLHGEQEVPSRAAFLINQIFQLWDHRWVYDFEELRLVASRAGFDRALVTERGFREGRDPQVAALDREERNDESLYAEMRKRHT
jgi:SAM-dependent methyltransferase